MKDKGHFLKVAHHEKPHRPPRRAKSKASKRKKTTSTKNFSKQLYLQDSEKEHRVMDVD